eukprot:TRINITY_DN1273_c1_g1_i6.p1 TRINITY_DN1273_c1_g1~~TRINITY_DN1273_c1_g1_i6.p1  ORF type:complete len:667 (+),score=271.68 TRINITY_DN1273_c1_g1_i6:29-2029(+)
MLPPSPLILQEEREEDVEEDCKLNVKKNSGTIKSIPESNSTFNFHPNTRPFPMEIHIQGFDMTHFGSRVLAMSRPTLYATSHYGQGKSVIIFVPNRKAMRSIVKDLSNFRQESDPNRNFLKVSQESLAPHLAHVSNKGLKESLSLGIAFYHEGLDQKEKKVATNLFTKGAVQIFVCVFELCWELEFTSHLVIVMGTQYYDGREHRHCDYQVTDVLQMIGRCKGEGKEDNCGKCVLFCFGPKKEYYKKFLHDPLPIESQLDQTLADTLNAEIVAKTIEGKQDCVDYLTWTFMYRRLPQNPNYYDLEGNSNNHISDHLSDLIERNLGYLEESKCIAVDELDVQPLNLGMIASFYNIRYSTIEIFSSSLKSKTKLKGIIEILASAAEFDCIPLRQGEDKILRKLGAHLPMKIEKPNYHSHLTKINVLLQSHFSRKTLTADLQADEGVVSEHSIRLIQAMVDVISSFSWLQPALAAMELSQMVTQATWDSDSVLRQVPHFDEKVLAKCKAMDVDSVFGILEMEDDQRNSLGLSDKQMQDVARFCNRYPNIELDHQISSHVVKSGESVEVVVNLTREMEEDEELTPVVAPFYPREKVEGWWLLIGDQKSNSLLSIKRITLQRETKTKLEFSAPEAGDYDLKLYFMCDSYAGCDQEFDIKLRVEPEEEAMEE